MLIQNLDLDEIAELPLECLHALLQHGNRALNLRPQQRLHLLLLPVNCDFEFVHRSGRIAEEPRQCGADAGLRPRAFKHDAIEDFDLIESVALGLEELPPLIDGMLLQPGHRSGRTESPADSA